MDYHFRNLVFEGGGVKGLAYVGAMEALAKRGILNRIERIGGTSAGAIYAAMVAVGYSHEEMWDIVRDFDFMKLLDVGSGPFNIFGNVARLLSEYGWYKGDYFHEWLKGLIIKKVGKNITFQQLHEMSDRPDLYICGTDLSRRQSVIFSHETARSMPIVDAVRISMSIPVFFKVVKGSFLGKAFKDDVYVDGGMLNNYPVQLFDQMKYITEKERAAMARKTEYYDAINKDKNDGELHIYNRQTLGFRLGAIKGKIPYRKPPAQPRINIENFFDYARAMAETFVGTQDDFHLHNDDWQRTIFIDTGDINTVQFNIDIKGKEYLKGEGIKWTKKYFEDWFDKPTTEAFNKP